LRNLFEKGSEEYNNLNILVKNLQEEEKELRQKKEVFVEDFQENMTEDQIRSIIMSVEKDNNEIQPGFGAMLFEQIMVQKYNRLRKSI